VARIGLLTLAPLVVFATLSAAFVLGTQRDAETVLRGSLDRPLPKFDLSPMPGTEAGISSADVTGQVVMINFFASWCSACRQEHPKLLELAKAQDVPIYGVNWKDSKGAGKLFLKRAGNPYVATGDDSGGHLGATLNVTGVPETYVVDAKGRLRYRHLGPITDKVWSDVLHPLLTKLETES
jgi:cytochrome c biogenesis protein CcmG, thiol:disulfide interchange protein DsbE